MSTPVASPSEVSHRLCNLLKPASDAIIFVAVFVRCPNPTSSPRCSYPVVPSAPPCHCPLSISDSSAAHPLHCKHILSPNNDVSDPLVANALQAVITAPIDFLFAKDSLPQHQDTDHDNPAAILPRDTPLDERVSPNAPILDLEDDYQPFALKHSRTSDSLLLTSPLTESPPLSPLSHTITQKQTIDNARTLPLNAVYDVLSEPETAPKHTSRNPTIPYQPSLHHAQSVDVMSPRVQSLPHRPSSSPPPRVHSLGLSPYSVSKCTDYEHNLAEDHQSRSFRHDLLAAKPHVFATTTKNGTRQYVYSRPLSSTHLLAVVSSVAYSSLYISALERTAARFAFLTENYRHEALLLHRYHRGEYETDSDLLPRSKSSSFLASTCTPLFDTYLTQCPLLIAKDLTRSLVEWLRSGTPSEVVDTPCLTRSNGSVSNIVEQSFEDDEHLKGLGDGDILPTSWLTLNHSNIGEHAPGGEASKTVSFAPDQSMKATGDPGNDAAVEGMSTSVESMNGSAFPWVAAVADDPDMGESDMARVLELGDSTLLFRYFPVRAIVSVIVALMEERRVCVIGDNTSLVSRAVIAFDNMLRPFEWPHCLSPILLEHMLPLLGAPFPFLVGMLSEHVHLIHELPLDEVVFADLRNGKVTSTNGLGDLSRHIVRSTRARVERRLSRTKNACWQQVLRATFVPFSPTISNTAMSYFHQDPLEHAADKSRPASIPWFTKSVMKDINNESSQNVWLEHGSAKTLDKNMRKFFAEVLGELRPTRTSRNAESGEHKPKNAFKKSTSFGAGLSLMAGRRDAERHQLMLSFTATQMYMQWEMDENRDRSFGIAQLDSSKAKKNASSRVQDMFPKLVQGFDGVEIQDILDNWRTGGNRGDCEGDAVRTKSEGGVWKAGLTNSRKFKNRRNTRLTRLHTGSDADECYPEIGNGELKREHGDVQIRVRTLSTECIADDEISYNKNAFLNMEVLPNQRGDNVGFGLPSDSFEAESSDLDTDEISDSGRRKGPMNAAGVTLDEVTVPSRRILWAKRRVRSTLVGANNCTDR